MNVRVGEINLGLGVLNITEDLTFHPNAILSIQINGFDAQVGIVNVGGTVLFNGRNELHITALGSSELLDNTSFTFITFKKIEGRPFGGKTEWPFGIVTLRLILLTNQSGGKLSLLS